MMHPTPLFSYVSESVFMMGKPLY